MQGSEIMKGNQTMGSYGENVLHIVHLVTRHDQHLRLMLEERRLLSAARRPMQTALTFVEARLMRRIALWMWKKNETKIYIVSVSVRRSAR